MDKIVYIDYSDNNPKDKTLCSNCKGYGDDKKKTKTFSDGFHDVTFKAIDNGIVFDFKTVEFMIDSKGPKISKTAPKKNSYTNGSNFYIKYTEDNCQFLYLSVYGVNSSFGSAESCQSGINIEKEISMDLSSFRGQEIGYQFSVSDVAGNTKESKLTKVKVDVVSPSISNLQTSISGNHVYFNITILNEDKNTFDKVEYFDVSDSNPKWKTLCNSLNGVCYKKVTFSEGDHDLTVRALDNAGNSATQNVVFTIA